jgi:hypothetical protein
MLENWSCHGTDGNASIVMGAQCPQMGPVLKCPCSQGFIVSPINFPRIIRILPIRALEAHADPYCHLLTSGLVKNECIPVCVPQTYCKSGQAAGLP